MRWWHRWLTWWMLLHPAVPQTPAPPPPPVPPHIALWEQLRRCEAPGGWATDTHNGFLGGLQFTLGTWWSHGGVGNPALADKITQMWVAERVLADQGWSAWPTCARRMGLL